MDYLSYPQTEKLCEWLLTAGLSYEEIGQKVQAEFGLTVSSFSLEKFYKNNVTDHLAKLRERAVNVAAGYVEEAIRTPGHFTAATVDALEAKAMQACFDPSTKPKELKIFLELVLRWQEQKLRAEQVQLQLRRLRLLERRQKKAEALFTVESKLTDGQVAERLRLIFKQNGTTESENEIEEIPATPRIPTLSP